MELLSPWDSHALQMANPRVNDAIQIAGGLTSTNNQGINLSLVKTVKNLYS